MEFRIVTSCKNNSGDVYERKNHRGYYAGVEGGIGKAVVRIEGVYY